MLDTRLRKNIDLSLILLTYLLAFAGIVIIASATYGDPVNYPRKQLIGIVIGSASLAAAALLDYHLYARFSRHIYVLNLLLLLMVFKLGHEAKGAARWIKIGGFQIQPSEFAKLFVILTLGVYLTKHRDTIHTFQRLAQSFLYILPPFALIAAQPDLGTGLVIIAIWFGMTFIAGAKARHLALAVLIGVVGFTGLWHTKILRDYQKARIVAFIEPEKDPKETGYHVLQARIAVGSGEMWGKGYRRGTQTHGGYLPEKHTDFIFSVIAEEWGFVGCVALVGVYALFLIRGALVIAVADEDVYGKLIASGIVTMFTFHIFQNVGMNIGIMPVAGVPLVLISAGLSSLVITLTCVGLLLSVRLHRHQLLF